ncbi:MAG TPA: hypothetical protein VMD79_08255 [Solirubrobacteraceae bacterium]|nr:hypothetical protein [Solirubrobacteraceae bacterium]
MSAASAAHERPAPGHGAPTPAWDGEPCPLCGARLHPEQEWCLSCGAAARTRLAPAPSWKGVIVTLAVIVALSVGVLAAALVKLAAGTTTPATLTRTVTTLALATTPARTTPGAVRSTSTPARRSAPATKSTLGKSLAAGSSAATTTPARAVEQIAKRFGLHKRIAEALRKHKLLPHGLLK